MRGGIGDDEGDARGVVGVAEEHLFSEDSAEAVGDEDDFAMLPDALALEVLIENLRELDGGELAAHGRGGVLGHDDIGLLEAGIGLDELGKIGSVCGAPGVAVAVDAVDEDDDARLETLCTCPLRESTCPKLR